MIWQYPNIPLEKDVSLVSIPRVFLKKIQVLEYLGTTNRVYRKSIPLMVDPDPSCRHVPFLISEMVKSQLFKRS